LPPCPLAAQSVFQDLLLHQNGTAGKSFDTGGLFVKAMDQMDDSCETLKVVITHTKGSSPQVIKAAQDFNRFLNTT
jgi:hypothetical protein